MPCLTLSTNVSLALDGTVDTSSVLSQLNSTVANILGYPHSADFQDLSNRTGVRFPVQPVGLAAPYVTVALEGSIPMCFGGTEEPAAYGEFVAIGVLNPELNKKLCAEIAFVLETMLSVPKSRFFLKFYDIEGYNCGLNGSIMVIESK